ncbi:MAG: ketoacyl-ACP synthase III [Candidatus Dadabacteria bacterium]|nr:MAG: ketoacyl-ACP synthase III [Candidatus Dadabacteria bacterium]
MLHVLGMGYAHPDIEISNQLLEDLDVGTNARWIEEKIGILKRRTSLPLDYIIQTRNSDPRKALDVATVTPTELGLKACKMALDSAGISAEQIGLVICNCCTPEATAPTESLRMARELGLTVPAYDVFTACPVFVLHIDFLRNFEEDKIPDYVLCFSTAALTQHVNYNERSDGAIWGDGAAAWVISPRHPGKLKVIDSTFMSDPTRCHAVVVDKHGHFHQDGRAVRDFSVRQTVRLIKALEQKYDLDWSRDVFIGHQANKTMLDQITRNRKIPESQHWHNVTEIGNQAGASAPAVLAMNWDRIKPGQRIVVAVVGAGLSWGSALFEAQ